MKNRLIVGIIFLIFIFGGCEIIESDKDTKALLDTYKTIKKDEKLRPFLDNESVLDRKIGTTTSCHESIYGEGDGCQTWQDCVDGKCVPELGRCITDKDCSTNLTCQGYHWCAKGRCGTNDDCEEGLRCIPPWCTNALGG